MKKIIIILLCVSYSLTTFGQCVPIYSVQTVNACNSYTWIDGNTYNNKRGYMLPETELEVANKLD